MRTAEGEQKAREEALREDREDRDALNHSEEEKVEAAKSIGLNTSGTWGRKARYTFKPLHDPPNYGSIHYWLAYAREVLFEARRRKAFISELRCARVGLERFAKQPTASAHHTAALRIHDELATILEHYSRSTK